MSQRDLLLAFAAGAASALLHLSGALGVLNLTVLTQLPLFAVGLMVGLPAATVAAAVACAFVVAVFPLTYAGVFALTLPLPVLVLLSRALRSHTGADGTLRWYPLGHVLAILAVLAVAILAGAALLLSGREGGMVGAIGAIMTEPINQALVLLKRPEMAPGEVAALPMIRSLAGFLAIGWQANVIINGLLAQWFVRRIGQNLRPSERFADLDLPDWLGLALAAALLASFLPGQTGDFARNAAIALALPFFLLGLSAIHAASIRLPGRIFILAGLYLFVIVAGWPALIVVALGVFEPWTHLRTRFAKSPREEEDE